MIHKELTYIIIGSFFKVHNALHNIWHEEIYEKAVQSELRSQGLKAERQKKFDVVYFDKNLGRYRIDLIVEDKIIIELKAVPEITPLHKAQLISYLKGYKKPLGILANFGSKSLEHRTFPNKLESETALKDNFDLKKIRFEGKENVRDLLIIANRILVTLGPGYFHQIYRRAFYYELKQAGICFDITRELSAEYRNEKLGVKEVNFFILGDLLLATVALKELSDLILFRFWNYIRLFKLRRGLIFNFNAMRLDFKYYSDV
ncbi:GxxExxY protein [Desulfococcaceae bacterium HSG9]|nr:GxxExxY protein [Desulfococcaceae bacterium HSG9]